MNQDREERRSCCQSFAQWLWRYIVSVLQQFICCPNFGEEYHQPRREDDRIRLKPETRLLVLGASDTGKSTFMRQMRLEFGDQYPIEERRRHQPHIRQNVFDSIHKLVKAVATHDLSYASAEAEQAAQRFSKWSHLEEALLEPNIDPFWTEAIFTLWEDRAIQEVYRGRSEFHLMTNADYFIMNSARILERDYTPTIDDLLRMRFVTRGAVTKTYELSNIRMTLHDMGGQRTERKEWIKQLDNPSAILFVASLSEYDQTVEETTECKNRVQESLDIFEELLGYAPFENTPVILLLNKTDIFNIKIKERTLRDFFPEYRGPDGDERQGREYITNLYEKITMRHRRNLLVRYTEATNRDNFKAIIAFVSNYVSRTIIGIGGLL